MTEAKRPLPEFDHPPLVEVVLGVQFRPKLEVPHIGVLWERFRKEFPRFRQQPPLAHAVERFGPPLGGASFEVLDTSMPRCWFLNADESLLIQVQADRFIQNWRKRGDTEYPRYERSLRGAFSKRLLDLETFLHEHDLGPLEPDQCEVTYVNAIALPAGGLGTMEQVLSCFSGKFSDDALPSPNEGQLTLHFDVPGPAGQPTGRLHVDAAPQYHVKTGESQLRLALTVRAAPDASSLDGVFSCLDRGREWIVRAFASMTTLEMHQRWGRKR